MSKEYKSLPVGKYGTKDEPGLEIIKYTGGQAQDDGSVRHGLLVKAIDITHEQALEAAAAAKNAANLPKEVLKYILKPLPHEGTQFLNIVLHDNWANKTGAALSFGSKKLAELKITANPDDLKGLQAMLYETAGTFLSAEQLSDGDSLETEYQKLITQISVNLGVLLRLETLAGMPVNFNPSAEQWQKLVGIAFTGEVTSSVGKNGKTFYNVRVSR